jgi:hypothetical protein
MGYLDCLYMITFAASFYVLKNIVTISLYIYDKIKEIKERRVIRKAFSDIMNLELEVTPVLKPFEEKKKKVTKKSNKKVTKNGKRKVVRKK